jgi:hypothetical protein
MPEETPKLVCERSISYEFSHTTIFAEKKDEARIEEALSKRVEGKEKTITTVLCT